PRMCGPPNSTGKQTRPARFLEGERTAPLGSLSLPGRIPITPGQPALALAFDEERACRARVSLLDASVSDAGADALSRAPARPERACAVPGEGPPERARWEVVAEGRCG
ncbi:MAG: hypothetical protein LC808_17775, partial [Actinobacteria bacterium]|nr:hypothetical protein [Actinomycetota bacterium]